MDISSAPNHIVLVSTIKVGDTVMVIVGNDNNKSDWQYGEKFKVKKIEARVYGTFAYKNKLKNICINKIIPIKNAL